MEDKSIQSKSILRHSINILDKIYSRNESLNYLIPLKEIETKLFNYGYNTLEDFKADLQKIPIYKNIEDYAHDENQILEEQCNTPIYDFAMLRKDSQIYTINIQDDPLQAHYSLQQALKEDTNRPLHRLYVSKNSDLILEARDSMNSLLVLFFKTKITPFEDSTDIMRLTADVAVVHPLGEFHQFDKNMSIIEGWIKVKVARTASIKRIIPKKLAYYLFDGSPLSVKKLMFEAEKDITAARHNEMTRQFINAIMGSCLDFFTLCYNDYVDNVLSKNTKTNQNYTQSRKVEKGSSTIDRFFAIKRKSLITQNITSDFIRYWRELEEFCQRMDVNAVYRKKYESGINRAADAEGYFKKVYFINSQTVVQLFQRSTVSQRINEIVSYSTLRNRHHIGRVKEIIWKDDGSEVIGITMERYHMTLKQFLRLNPKLTAHQRLYMIVQLLRSISTIHEFNIAHRDISTVNFMVNINKSELLEDGSAKIEVFLIDFGKAVFFDPKDAAKWWVDSDEVNIYRDEVKPKTSQELIVWCKSLPFMMAKPDHGYRFYRSIKTLPRSRNDHSLLPYLIDPAAEDIFALGSLVWKILSGMEPWPGIFDTDLKGLRETVEDDYNIRSLVNREVPGITSRALLYMFLRAEPYDRRPAIEILSWLESPGIKQSILNECNGIYDKPLHVPAPKISKRKRLKRKRLQ
ncbi:hypothetical protein G6F70_003608 [Rhizopus microsporus]|nr:hypothetical protein G6F71_001240 [Rhizopus microsporus]KAG1200937.1 hypothetical protein G6F70_003608 [Rhizopus microsporus]KAG1212855.1 hypothetical protein G6F69_003337 [Rhizopus microsporus]KAG1234829.1 hypothetical protein G6F67_003232 [Rhizopus microsporus]KAG1267072.1 hypothetical protein G6F68_002233 [Rhizopus microsporus]